VTGGKFQLEFRRVRIPGSGSRNKSAGQTRLLAVPSSTREAASGAHPAPIPTIEPRLLYISLGPIIWIFHASVITP